jgi:cyanophycinase
MPGSLALVGSGEYLPVMAGVEGMLLAGRPPRYVQIPTAAAPEGEQSLKRWLDLGAQQAARLGVEQVPVLVRNRAEAGDARLAGLISGAGLVYLSGGNPSYLASTLLGTLVGDAVLAAWQSGSALAGCSAGAIALTDWVPSFRSLDREAGHGLAAVRHLRVLPHFDKMGRWAPDLAAAAVASAAAGTTVIGIDEDTAIVDMTGTGQTWQVYGRQQAWVLADGSRKGFPAGSTLAPG